MSVKDDLGNRMKDYENTYRHMVPKKTPVILRLDGKAFHTLTRGMIRPFDDALSICMVEATKFLCENIQNVKLAYTQSDEISLFLNDYEEIRTDSWFGNNLQKMVSVSASMCTQVFNKEIRKNISQSKEAFFDSRVFTLPKEEVCNYFIWRQQDATRNSIQSVAQANFSHKECMNKNTTQLQDMLMLEKSINWNNIPTRYKRGIALYKSSKMVYPTDIPVQYAPPLGTTHRTFWEVDYEIPIFTQDRSYVEKYV